MVLFLHLIEFLYRRSSLHHMQRSHEKLSLNILPSSIAAEIVQKSNLYDNRLRCSLHYHHRQPATLRMPTETNSMGPLPVRNWEVY
jgi:CRISPR/Cas system-associated protein Cas10 (large subunit of type III CRISPR-Cas system)